MMKKDARAGRAIGEDTMANLSSAGAANAPTQWPELDYAGWKDTAATLHLWTQIVGKIRMGGTPPINHSWHVTLFLTARGLTTSPIPHGERMFQIDFDFVAQQLVIVTSDGGATRLPLRPLPVAEFYRELMARLGELGLHVHIHARPNEVLDAIPFEQDFSHASYDGQAAARFWRVLLQAQRVFQQFRGRYLGKCSPVHFFWGSFDLAVTRFSGRPAPLHPGGVPNCPDAVTREAYSHEVSSCGFWPGNEQMPTPLFYSYAYPEPPGFGAAHAGPHGARYDAAMREFVLPYDELRRREDPDAALLAFLQDTYQAAADLGGWDRAVLERPT